MALHRNIKKKVNKLSKLELIIVSSGLIFASFIFINAYRVYIQPNIEPKIVDAAQQLSHCLTKQKQYSKYNKNYQLYDANITCYHHNILQQALLQQTKNQPNSVRNSVVDKDYILTFTLLLKQKNTQALSVALALHLAKEYNQAINRYQSIPSTELSNYYLALAYQDSKNYQAAIDIFKQLNADFAPYTLMGIAYYQNKQYQQAVTVFNQAIKNKPTKQNYEYLGDSYAKLGKYKLAIKAYNTIDAIK